MPDKGKRGKRPRAAAVPKPKKRPHARKPPDTQDERLSWRVGRLDLEGVWGWHQVDEGALRRIHGKLRDFETMNWGEVQGRGHKFIPVENLCSGAQDRLLECELDDQDGLWELRLSGKERLWGMRDGSILLLVWWDPDHTVCPTKRR